MPRDEREALIARGYIQHCVPRTLEVIHGAEILDSEGNRSAECDLVVQSAATPPLMLGEAFHLVPVEWAYGVIEVKSRLDATQLADAQAKIARAKRLRKLTYVEPTSDFTVSLRGWLPERSHGPALAGAYVTQSYPVIQSNRAYPGLAGPGIGAQPFHGPHGEWVVAYHVDAPPNTYGLASRPLCFQRLYLGPNGPYVAGGHPWPTADL